MRVKSIYKYNQEKLIFSWYNKVQRKVSKRLFKSGRPNQKFQVAYLRGLIDFLEILLVHVFVKITILNDFQLS